MLMSKKKKSCRLKRTLITCLVLAVLAFIGWLVYYLFFAADPEELDGSLFREEGKKAGTEPEGPVMESVPDAEAAEDTEDEAAAETAP